MKHELTILRIIGVLILCYSVVRSDFNFLFVALALSATAFYGILKYIKHIKQRHTDEKRNVTPSQY